jgi:hypothetical protein
MLYICPPPTYYLTLLSFTLLDQARRTILDVAQLLKIKMRPDPESHPHLLATTSTYGHVNCEEYSEIYEAKSLKHVHTQALIAAEVIAPMLLCVSLYVSHTAMYMSLIYTRIYV